MSPCSRLMRRREVLIWRAKKAQGARAQPARSRPTAAASICCRATSPTLQARQQQIRGRPSPPSDAELDRIQDDLRKERARLTRLRARLAESRAALSARLVHLYKAELARRGDRRPRVRGLRGSAAAHGVHAARSRAPGRPHPRPRALGEKAEATATEVKLDRFEVRQRKVTKIVSQRRLEVLAIQEPARRPPPAGRVRPHRQAPGAGSPPAPTVKQLQGLPRRAAEGGGEGALPGSPASAAPLAPPARRRAR